MTVGIVLAGGKATRLRPLTWVTNKHLLPVFDRPMIDYSLSAMEQAGIEEVIVVTNPEHVKDISDYVWLSDWQHRLRRFTFMPQKNPKGGIADAIGTVKNVKDNILVILGDNIFQHDLAPDVRTFHSGAKIFATRVEHPEHYGVIRTDKEGDIVSIVEKPQDLSEPAFAQTGIYLYDSTVWERIAALKPSERGELEVTDLNNSYLKEGKLDYAILSGKWLDAGTSPDELLKASIMAKELFGSPKTP